MKYLILVLLLLAGTAQSQTPPNRRITVFYFGASDCGFCLHKEHIANIDRLRTELATKHAPIPFKFVMVVMDDSLDEGYQFTKKYLPWDEIAIGQRYSNELMLEHLNRTAIPGVPHIMLYLDSLQVDEHSNPLIKKRNLLLDLVGESNIGKWIQSGYPIRW
jgi:hypothetical protein